MDAVIALSLALASLAVSADNTNGLGEESGPGSANSSLDAHGKNIKNNKLAKILYFFFIKLHSTFLGLMIILTINRFR
ncbi:MAG TPA: hypothetical protein DCX03_12295 [Bacteroidales bacterium]|nr:hypothetical protein [Bacteroidales bacterium]